MPIRVSAAGFASIRIDDKYLLCLNKSSLTMGNKVYTPFGGALRVHESMKPILCASLEAVFEQDDDLRLTIPEENIPNFIDWFNSRIGRETSPIRELREELVGEEKVLTKLPDDVLIIDYILTRQEISKLQRPGKRGELTHRVFEYFTARFRIQHSREYEESIIKEASRPDSRLILATQAEIKNLRTELGVQIANICLPLCELYDGQSECWAF